MSQEDYTLVIEIKSKYMVARPKGMRNFDTVKAMTLEIFDVARSVHRSIVLIDVRELKGRLGVLDSYKLVTEVFQKLHRKGISAAAIVDPQLPSPRSWFLETVSLNRGFNLRIFSDYDEALEWLLS
ncbi:MAG: hypothetical protein PVF83_06425 [Anaerolineales bacterium]|jgi:hypothetical protein